MSNAPSVRETNQPNIRRRIPRLNPVPYREREYSTVMEMCRYMGLGRSTGYALVRSGQVESTIVAGRILVRVKSALKLAGESV